MIELTIYHNPHCSKSNCALDFLQESQLSYKVIDYMFDSPDFTQLTDLLKKLNMPAFDLIRKNEKVFKQFEGKVLTNDQWIQAMVDNPILIERPIVVFGEKAVVARPMERISELLNQR